MSIILSSFVKVPARVLVDQAHDYAVRFEVPSPVSSFIVALILFLSMIPSVLLGIFCKLKFLFTGWCVSSGVHSKWWLYLWQKGQSQFLSPLYQIIGNLTRAPLLLLPTLFPRQVWSMCWLQNVWMRPNKNLWIRCLLLHQEFCTMFDNQTFFLKIVARSYIFGLFLIFSTRQAHYLK